MQRVAIITQHGSAITQSCNMHHTVPNYSSACACTRTRCLESSYGIPCNTLSFRDCFCTDVFIQILGGKYSYKKVGFQQLRVGQTQVEPKKNCKRIARKLKMSFNNEQVILVKKVQTSKARTNCDSTPSRSSCNILLLYRRLKLSAVRISNT